MQDRGRTVEKFIIRLIINLLVIKTLSYNISVGCY